MGSQAFLSVYLKQRGLSIAHVSFATAASVVFQLLGSSFSAVIADKIGRSKPIIFAHMTVSVIVSLTFMTMPSIPPDSTIYHFWLRSSNHENISNLIAESWCNHSDAINTPKICNIFDTANLQYSYNEQNCHSINSNKNSLVLSFDFNGTKTFQTPELCHQENNEIIFTSPPLEFCNFTYCKFLVQECLSEIEKCQKRGSNRLLLLWMYGLLITLHHMARSSIFRFFDLTVLSLITENDADFGRQRVFSIFGTLVGPSLIGYVLQATSPPGDRKNYSMAFGFSSVFTVLSGISCWNVSIRVKDPGRRMWKKAVTLLKEPDILVFILLLTIMGTAYNFITIFVGWYLEDLGASKLLIGTFFPACNLFTVVFLYTSKWWVNKFGIHNLFIIGLLSHAVFGISYSFLEVPWVAFLVGSITIVFFYHIFWVAVMHYSHKIAPDGLYATVIVTAGVLHFIVSKYIFYLFIAKLNL